MKCHTTYSSASSNKNAVKAEQFLPRQDAKQDSALCAVLTMDADASTVPNSASFSRCSIHFIDWFKCGQLACTWTAN